MTSSPPDRTDIDLTCGARGLSRMADTAGISKQLLSFIIAGDREVTADVYRRFAEALLR
ncbi:helix-turn-helix transcriptional regulator [Bradyrhizobium manausense]|uniref:helix-turn-helix domain-containing protein n=1 Tax=Bradyrhizobium manausense TaxID=989370 RepID=UPI0028A250B6|nr:helix-turn-helix transcriptional regulator [Bradyrhizobium manausense]